MTLQQRADAYAAAYPQFPASHLRVVQEQGHDVLYGLWLLGNDYRNRTEFYGAYPPGYLERAMALFPDIAQETRALGTGPEEPWPVLHVFSGSLPQGPYIRVDMRHDPRALVMPDYKCSVYDLPYFRGGTPACNWPFGLVFADPPYSDADAVNYNTPMVDRRRALASIASVMRPGGHLVWLDTCWPMHRKDEWVTVGRLILDEPEEDALQPVPEGLVTVGRIGLVRSTNHRVRLISIFERQAA